MILKAKNIVIDDVIEFSFDFRILREIKERHPCLIGRKCGGIKNDSIELRSIEDQILKLLSHRLSIRDVVAATELLIVWVTLGQYQPHKASMSGRKEGLRVNQVSVAAASASKYFFHVLCRVLVHSHPLPM